MRMTVKKLTTVVSALTLLLAAPMASAFQVNNLFNSPHDIWNVMGDHFELTNGALDHAAVRKEIENDRNLQYDLFQLTNNAQPYIYYVYKQTQQRGMPAVLALLPMVESDYTPFQYSGVGATGLWQLMPSTATGFGIKINWWFDGRRDIVSSTNTALNYLQYLHDTFHNWDLAIAAYNSGEGTVWNAIHYNQRHNLPTDFWDLPLPQQTKLYVPKLLAFAQIIKERSHYGLRLFPIANQPYFTAVRLHKQYNIGQLANMVGISEKAFRNLNPAFRRAKTAPFSAYFVLVPIKKEKTFRHNLDKYNQQLAAHEPKHLTHTVKNGDSLSVIALHNHTTVSAIKKLNHMQNSVIHVGQKLMIPVPISNKVSARIAETYVPGPRAMTYIVKAGDSLYHIAGHFHVSEQDIFFWNHFNNHEMLHPGMQLTLLVNKSLAE